MKYSYPVVLIVLVAAMSISIGIGVYIGEKQHTQAAADVSRPCQPIVTTNADVPTAKPVRSKQDERHERIAFAVSQPIKLRQELLNYKKGRYANVDELAQATRFSYKVAGQIDDLIKDIEVNQLKDSEIGYQTKDLKQLKREVLLHTLNMIAVISKKGGINVCLWEGGCLDNDVEYGIKNTTRRIREELAEL